MRRSPLRHPVAVLRNFLGLQTKAFGKLVEVNPATIQAIELLRRPLTEEIASKIANSTSVNQGWLMKGDPEAPILSSDGKPYTKLEARIAESSATGELDDANRLLLLSTATLMIENLLWNGAKTGRDYASISYKLTTAIQAIAADLNMEDPEMRWGTRAVTDGHVHAADLTRLKKRIHEATDLAAEFRNEARAEEKQITSILQKAPEYRNHLKFVELHTKAVRAVGAFRDDLLDFFRLVMGSEDRFSDLKEKLQPRIYEHMDMDAHARALGEYMYRTWNRLARTGEIPVRDETREQLQGADTICRRIEGDTITSISGSSSAESPRKQRRRKAAPRSGKRKPKSE